MSEMTKGADSLVHRRKIRYAGQPNLIVDATFHLTGIASPTRRARPATHQP